MRSVGSAVRLTEKGTHISTGINIARGIEKRTGTGIPEGGENPLNVVSLLSVAM